MTVWRKGQDIIASPTDWLANVEGLEGAKLLGNVYIIDRKGFREGNTVLPHTQRSSIRG